VIGHLQHGICGEGPKGSSPKSPLYCLADNGSLSKNFVA